MTRIWTLGNERSEIRNQESENSKLNARRHECLSIFSRNQNQTFQGFSSVSVYQTVSLLVEYVVLTDLIFHFSNGAEYNKGKVRT